METGIIYMFENNINHKKYIGKTVRPKRRYKEHKKANENSYFHHALRKYGFDNFTYIILEEFTFIDKNDANKKLNYLEKHYIKKYNTTNREYGYNRTYGGDGTCGYVLSDETKLKISIAKKGDKNPMKRKEVREKVSNTLKGRKGHPCTEEHKRNLSNRMHGKNNPMYGKYGEKNPSFGINWTNNISEEEYKIFCKKRQLATKGEKNPMYNRKQKKSLWLLPDGSKKIMANCAVAARHKDWIKIEDINE